MASNILPIGRYTIGGIDYENVFGIVVFLDALGVKGIWKGKEPAKVLQNWNEVYYIFDEELSSLEGTNLSAFSDTFIISMRGNQRLNNQPWRFVEILCNAILPAFVRSMDYGFFFRGVITLDYFSRSTKTLIGPAVDEAANFYENGDWIGISLSPSTRSFLKDRMTDTNSSLIVEYDIPQAPAADHMTWAVDWTKWDRSYKYWNILVDQSNFYAHANDYRKYIKYENTLSFYTACSTL